MNGYADFVLFKDLFTELYSQHMSHLPPYLHPEQ